MPLSAKIGQGPSSAAASPGIAGDAPASGRGGVDAPCVAIGRYANRPAHRAVGDKACRDPHHIGLSPAGVSLAGVAAGSLMQSSSSAPFFGTLFTARLTG